MSVGGLRLGESASLVQSMSFPIFHFSRRFDATRLIVLVCFLDVDLAMISRLTLLQSQEIFTSISLTP